MPFKKNFVPLDWRHVFLLIAHTAHYLYFSWKNLTFFTFKSAQDQDPHGAALDWGFGSESAFGILKNWIGIKIRIETNADPQHCFKVRVTLLAKDGDVNFHVQEN